MTAPSETYSNCETLRLDAWALIERLSYARGCVRRFVESPDYDEDYKVAQENISTHEFTELLRVAEDLVKRVEGVVGLP